MANYNYAQTRSGRDRDSYDSGVRSRYAARQDAKKAAPADYTTAPDRVSLYDLNRMNQSAGQSTPKSDTPVLDFWKRQQAAKNASATDYAAAPDRISLYDLRQMGKAAVQNTSKSDSPVQTQQAAESAADVDYTTAPDRISLYDLNRMNKSAGQSTSQSNTPLLDAWKAGLFRPDTDYTYALDRVPFTQANTQAGGTAAETKAAGPSSAEQSVPWLNTPQYGDDGTPLSATATQSGTAGYNGSGGQAGPFGPDTDYTYALDRVPFTQVNTWAGGSAAETKATGLSSPEQSAPWLNTPQYGDDGIVLSQDSSVQGQNTLPYDFGDDGVVLSQDKLAQYGNRGYDESIWEDNPVRKGLRQLVLGNYADETTPLGTTLQILAGLAGVDAPADVRDLVYDLTHWEDTTEHKWQLALDLVAVLPIIGAVKNAGKAGELAQEVLRHGDEISDVLKALPSGTDEAAEIIGDLAKHSDEAAGLTQGALKNGDDINAIIDEVFDEGDELRKTIRNIPDDEDDWLELPLKAEDPDNWLDIDEATKGTGKTFSPINPGPLDESIANTFRSGTYTKKVLTEDTTFYRVYGGGAGEVGLYMSRTPQLGGMQSQLDLALNPKWGNAATDVTKVTVPKGTIIYEGFAAPQTINGGAGFLMGGGNQIYIPEVNASWFGK